MKLLQRPLKMPYFEKYCLLNNKEHAEDLKFICNNLYLLFVVIFIIYLQYLQLSTKVFSTTGTTHRITGSSGQGFGREKDENCADLCLRSIAFSFENGRF